jgi:hypothetical protein
MRINIFKKIVEMLLDMANGIANSAAPSGDSGARDERRASFPEFSQKFAGREGEKELLRAVFEARYPEYSALKKRADEIISALSSSGVGIEFPEFFEGGSLAVKITLGKRDGAEAVSRKAEGIDRELLRELLSML